MTTALVRCCDCRHSLGRGQFCRPGNRHARGRALLKCSSFMRPQPPPVRVPGHGFVVAWVPGRLGPKRAFIRPRPS